jgi:hypothetical protein
MGALGVAACSVLLIPAPVVASPGMIRFGYAGCQACHLSPQGRGLLTEYGKGIDDTQSARRGVYTPDESRQRRLFHDVRVMAQVGTRSELHADAVTSVDARLWYRSAVALTESMRVSGMVSLDVPGRDVAPTGIHALPSPPQIFVRQALWELTPRKGLYLAIGRDTLPSGVEIADQASYMRAWNGQGITEVPTQVKLYVSTPRFQVTPYLFGPSGHEAQGFHTAGAGVLAETYLLGDRLVAGVSTRLARNAAHDIGLAGVYARIGLGRWVVLTEHDVTRRTGRAPDGHSFDQYTGFAQVLFYATDWLVVSLSGDRLAVEAPDHERRFRWRPEVSARISPHLTIAASVGTQRVSGQHSTTALVQLFLKTVS